MAVGNGTIELHATMGKYQPILVCDQDPKAILIKGKPELNRILKEFWTDPGTKFHEK